MIPCGMYRGRRKADVLTFRLNDDAGRPENVPDRSQVETNITELDHLESLPIEIAPYRLLHHPDHTGAPESHACSAYGGRGKAPPLPGDGRYRPAICRIALGWHDRYKPPLGNPACRGVKSDRLLGLLYTTASGRRELATRHDRR
jgi:hypothetical protein